MTTRKSVEWWVRDKLRKSKWTVFLRKDFAAAGSYSQVGRVLRKLVEQGKLARVGVGLYAKARQNRINGKTMLAAAGGFDQVTKEALTRLGVRWAPSRAEVAYQLGTSTQIPANAHLRVSKSFKREIAFGKFRLTTEVLEDETLHRKPR